MISIKFFFNSIKLSDFSDILKDPERFWDPRLRIKIGENNSLERFLLSVTKLDLRVSQTEVFRLTFPCIALTIAQMNGKPGYNAKVPTV